MEMKVVDSGYITKARNGFLIDRENLDTGEEIVSPGDRIQFMFQKRKYEALVTNQSFGRDEDVFLLSVLK
jgi:hypothetical protein